MVWLKSTTVLKTQQRELRTLKQIKAMQQLLEWMKKHSYLKEFLYRWRTQKNLLTGALRIAQFSLKKSKTLKLNTLSVLQSFSLQRARVQNYQIKSCRMLLRQLQRAEKEKLKRSFSLFKCNSDRVRRQEEDKNVEELRTVLNQQIDEFIQRDNKVKTKETFLTLKEKGMIEHEKGLTEKSKRLIELSKSLKSSSKFSPKKLRQPSKSSRLVNQTVCSSTQNVFKSFNQKPQPLALAAAAQPLNSSRPQTIYLTQDDDQNNFSFEVNQNVNQNLMKPSLSQAPRYSLEEKQPLSNNHQALHLNNLPLQQQNARLGDKVASEKATILKNSKGKENSGLKVEERLILNSSTSQSLMTLMKKEHEKMSKVLAPQAKKQSPRAQLQSGHSRNAPSQLGNNSVCSMSSSSVGGAQRKQNSHFNQTLPLQMQSSFKFTKQQPSQNIFSRHKFSLPIPQARDRYNQTMNISGNSAEHLDISFQDSSRVLQLSKDYPFHNRPQSQIHTDKSNPQFSQQAMRLRISNLFKVVDKLIVKKGQGLGFQELSSFLRLSRQEQKLKAAQYLVSWQRNKLLCLFMAKWLRAAFAQEIDQQQSLEVEQQRKLLRGVVLLEQLLMRPSEQELLQGAFKLWKRLEYQQVLEGLRKYSALLDKNRMQNYLATNEDIYCEAKGQTEHPEEEYEHYLLIHEDEDDGQDWVLQDRENPQTEQQVHGCDDEDEDYKQFLCTDENEDETELTSHRVYRLDQTRALKLS